MAKEKALRKKKRSHRGIKYVFMTFAVLAVGLVCIRFSPLKDWIDFGGLPRSAPYVFHNTEFENTLEVFAAEHNLQRSDWPDELLEAVEKNPELENFVLNYPLQKENRPEINLDEYRDTDTVPLLFQWDQRWGYTQYAGGPMGLTGCGPTCLSMVSIYLLDNPDYTPRYIAEFSKEHGYSVSGNGSAWALISEGGETLGLDVTEIPLDENRIIQNLEVGNPIICVMGPGDFTATGHFIVMTDYTDGKIKVNDPYSQQRSEILWDYEQIQDQILNLWVCRAPI